MITPEWLINELGYLQTHKDLQESILRDIVRRLMKTDFNVSDTAAWQTEKLQQAGVVYSDIVAEAAKRTKKSTEDIHKAFADAKVEVFDYGDEVLEKAGHVPEMFKALSPKMIKILNAAFKKTTKEVRNLTMTTATTTQSLFIRSCDLAHMQIVSGAFTYQEAIANAIRMAAKEGTKVIYPSGYSCSLDAAVRRAVLTGVNQTTGKLQEMRAVDMDVDLMEITAHSGARPEHAAWQGKVVSRYGRSGYLTLQDIGYGEVKGFMGANCRHNWHLFFEGISKSAYSKEQLDAWEKETVTYNGEELPVWQARDRQRAMERNVRSSKQLLVAYDEAAKNVFTDEERMQWKALFNNESVKLKGYEAKLKDFCEQTGLHRDKFREQVFAVETENGIKGFGKSVSQKAVKAHKKEIDKYTAYHYNKDGTIVVTDDWTYKDEKVPRKYKPYAVVDTMTAPNKKPDHQRNRTYYDKDGMMCKQVHGGPHGEPKKYNYGKNGEHMHLYTWDDDGKLLDRITDDVKPKEREECADIL